MSNSWAAPCPSPSALAWPAACSSPAIGGTGWSRLRSQDLIGRYGGEEFLVLLPRTPLAGALVLAGELRAAVEQAHFEFVGRTVPVTLSIGVAGGVLEPGDRWDGLVAAADEAMYRAKRAGRNQVAAAEAPRPAAGGPGADSATAQPR
ncbi:hypothetical protein C8245_06205 [Paracidovorax avenae]|nr:hypothetical protein C8245_06205 [Paracidovorax avenae]